MDKPKEVRKRCGHYGQGAYDVVCPKCYSEQQQKLREAVESERLQEYTDAVKRAKLMRLPNLTGLDIDKAIVVRQNFIDFIAPRIQNSGTDAEKEAMISTFEYICNSAVDASVWIKNKTINGFIEILREYSELYDKNNPTPAGEENFTMDKFVPCNPQKQLIHHTLCGLECEKIKEIEGKRTDIHYSINPNLRLQVLRMEQIKKVESSRTYIKIYGYYFDDENNISPILGIISFDPEIYRSWDHVEREKTLIMYLFK